MVGVGGTNYCHRLRGASYSRGGGVTTLITVDYDVGELS